MIRKNVKIIIFVLLLTYINKAHPQNIRFLLNEDSTYIKECLLINLEEKELKDKQYAILLNIVSHYIKAEENDFQEYDEFVDGLPVVINVYQVHDYKGNSVYRLSWGGISPIKPTLTNITNIQDRYIFFNLYNEKTLLEDVLPIFFLEYWHKKERERDELPLTEQSIKILHNDASWIVLMCKDSTKHVVIKDIPNIEICEYYESCVKYLNAFSCDL